MSRRARFALTEIPQHVVQRGNNRQATFFSGQDYEVYLECLRDAARRFACSVHAYVLMTNHVHLLATPHEPFALAKVMQSVGRRYVRYINSGRQRSGTLWEGRYKASLVGTAGYVMRCYCYIENNPVRAGMVEDARDYRWSSCRRNAGGESDSWLSEHSEFSNLGETLDERRRNYAELLMLRGNGDPEGEIRDAVNQNRIYGSDSFQQDIESALQRRVRPVRRGRPKAGLAGGAERQSEIPL